MGVVVQANKNPQDRHWDILNHVDYRLAETDADKEEIYRMRYRAYLNEGAIEPRGDARLSDRFDDLKNSWTFGIYIDGVLASSIRISVATPDNPETPAVDAFPDLLEPELARGKIIVDPNRFVAEPARARRFPELPYVTVRLGYVACAYFQADLGTATVRKEHQAFYRRVFLQNPLCEPRPYPTLTKPLSLMAAEYAVVRDRIFERYPYFRSTFFERRMLFERRLAPSSDTIVSLPEQAMNVASIVPRS
ncbi:hypothetical protein JQ557_22580 [Bradyrhizobium sp. U87765 SZCCT0131]|uniref:N-acyl amino acid synthase FeeM domain-containing protein n=1 Tax=unclassified Bradyrhizobium TaxID=2631580 RepID=UPI001BA86316|nr:hypothetical protein [Bradyrhizobium sp. U87765 SZCCT0131]MBR1260375.1 hypothetical protein [Bradyrhizobium sp. U87765 SZCCT0134]MBR1307376.1 hypothetical protein [Bradyrhizobium sp. U87765 SZCCT0110]MBR1321330.1 hypothetical protein [Bradyrhizobium sp. U87765 SZCCT0109]MBR1349643.1 hypothetical protein [Bradyrhizobium sp. U87765 SZCCT0048]